MSHASDNWWLTGFVLAICAGILLRIATGLQGKAPFIRRIAGLNAIDEAVGRATEMGRPILMVPGIGVFSIIQLQALNIFTYVISLACKMATPIRLCVATAPLFALARDAVQRAYSAAGRPDQYDPTDVRFLTEEQFAFAASVSGLILREQVAATFLMGEFYAESLIFAETANRVGAIQIASSTQITQTPFFIAACDYVLIGDEFYAASAYLSREPVAMGSLIGQDYGKIAFVLLILLGSLILTATGNLHVSDTPLLTDLLRLKQ
ncbi:MAG: hypothetical protein HUU60_09215 [Armatimonadetes bacterium]|nr:hypothetical protein [Armatimonadota bacterium]